MKVFIACDHAAFEEKEQIKSYVKELGAEVVDCGPDSADRVNYPDYAAKVAKEVAGTSEDEVRGILLCGSGIGVSMVANRFAGVRAALCRNAEEAKLSREHNNANILCMGARLISVDTMKEMVSLWLEAKFEGGRHAERISIFTDWGEKS